MTRPTARRRLALAACFVFAFSAFSMREPAAESVQTVQKTADAASAAAKAIFSCMKWKIVGLCFWLHCSLKGCKVKTSLKVFNYAPEAYVTVLPYVGQGSFVSSSLDASGNIEARKGKAPRDHQTQRDAALFGHPLGASLIGLSGLGAGLVCPSRAVPTFPYYKSPLDAAVWRGMVSIESLYPAASIPGLREIGAWPTATWGNLFPRTGRVVQQEEPKAAAVIAQRVGDIVTRWNQPHVYVPLPAVRTGDFGMKYWDPPALLENSAWTGTWQMFRPKVDTNCYVFGIDDSSGTKSWSDGRRSEDGAYAFNLWRPYRCCKKRGKFLFDIDF